MKKYSYFDNEQGDYTIGYDVNGDGEALLAIAKDVEKADFLSKAANSFEEWNIVGIDNDPEDSIEVIGYNEKWKNEEYNPEGISICFKNDQGTWTIAVWSDEESEWGTEYSHSITSPTHWREKPKPPII